MAPSRRTGRSRFTLVLLVLASITLLTLDFRGSGPTNGLREVASAVFDPVRSAGGAVARPFANAWDGVAGQDDLEKENEELRKRIDELEGQRIDEVVALREFEDLKDQLEVRQRSDIPTVAARITSGPLTSFASTLEIDRGSGDGVRKGMAVVTAAGMVGRVVRVTGGRSTIALITDPSFRFGVRLASQGSLGIAEGTGNGGLLRVQGIAKSSGARRGDTVITSGEIDSPFPPGVQVGTVTAVANTEDQTEKVLTVEPVADLESLTYVTVLLCDVDCS